MTKQIALIILACLMTIATYAQVPGITSFSPDSGSVGGLLTISGTHLSSPTSLTVGGIPAIIVSNTGSTLVAMVMPGTPTGAVSITTTGGTAVSGSNFTVIPSSPPSTQQGPKLVGTGSDSANQGYSVSISADGNTAIVGGPNDNNGIGAAWIYTRTGATWSQQGAKLVGTGAVGGSLQGNAVSLSADGNTAIVGGPADNSDTGAVWIYTRTGNIWSQQGPKLVGTGVVGTYDRQGTSVSISADGNTAIVAGPEDNDTGAVWIFIRSGTTWSQQGPKLVGTGQYCNWGTQVSLSADGNTAIEGSLGTGAAYIFIRKDTVWSQQAKLVGTGQVGNAYLGAAVCLSADGNTALVGGPYDNNSMGAVWVFTRTDSTWSQQGGKLFIPQCWGNTEQGGAVALSADGNIAIVGQYYAVGGTGLGVVGVFTRTDSVWSLRGPKLIGTGNPEQSSQGRSVAISADGNTAIIGGTNDNQLSYSGLAVGAAWVFTASGCSAGTLNDTVIVKGDTCIALQSGATYQWYSNYAHAGDTAQTFLPSQNSMYECMINLNGCINVSNCVSVTGVGINEIGSDNINVSLQPNPAIESCKILIDDAGGNVFTAALMDISGRQISSLGEINGNSLSFPVSQYAKGVYLVKITNEQSFSIVRKLVVE